MVIDDEKYSRENIKDLLKSYEQFEIVGESSSAEDAIKKIRKLKPHLLFLDIQLSGINGLDFAKTIKNFPQIMIVFVSAYDEYALDAFSVNAIDYITKPISPSRFEETVQKLEKYMEILFPRMDKIPVRNKDGFEFIEVGDICYIEAIGKNLVVHTKESVWNLHRTTLTTLQKNLPESFIRTHKSYIVNTEKVRKMRKELGMWEIITICGNAVPVSRHFLNSVKEKLHL